MRGTAVLGIQQAVALVTSTTLHVVTGRLLGPEAYGLFFVVHSVLSLGVWTFLAGLPDAVSRLTAENQRNALGILRTGVAYQAVVALLVAGVVYVSADPLAGLLGNDSLAPMLRLVSLAIPLTGVAYVYIQSLNGLHRFGRQAIALGALNVFNLVGVLLFLRVESGAVIGAVRGLVYAAGATAVIAVFLSHGTPRGDGPASGGNLALQGLQFSMTYLAIAAWERVDLIMLQSLGNVPGDVGLFTAATAITAAPEAIFFPLLIALFPAIARSTAAGAVGETTWYMRKSLGYAFRGLCPLVVGSVFVGREILDVFYGDAYVNAGFAIGPLVLVVLFYTLYQLMDTYLRGSGRSALSVKIALSLLLVHVSLNFVLIPRFQLAGVLTTMVVTSILAAAVTGVPVSRLLALRVPWTSAIKIAVASYVAFVPFHFWNPGGLGSLGLAVPCLAVYAGLLRLLRELDADDMGRARELARMVGLGRG